MKFPFLASALSAALFFMLSTAPNGNAQDSPTPDCGNVLNNQEFCCQYKDANGSSGVEAFAFSGTENPTFNLTTGASGLYTCTCQVNATVNNPKFDISKYFICNSPGIDAALVGQATPTKIIKGQWIYQGAATIYSCNVGACPP